MATSRATAAHEHRRALESLLGIPATEGNRIDVLRNGVEIFPAMLEEIHGAERSVDLLTFVYWSGTIAKQMADAIVSAAGRGVRVRVLLDAVGARSMDRDLVQGMRDADASVEWFRPPTTLKIWEQEQRTHRKILVCDDRVGFTGGVGIAKEWEGDARNADEWRDTHLRIAGPAVDGLRAAFLENWAETEHPLFDDRDVFEDHPRTGDSTVMVVRGKPGPGPSDIATLYATLLGRARRRIRLSTAYFSPDDDLEALLCGAVRGGVRVEVLLPGPHADKRVVQISGERTYEALLDAGVEIWRYQPTMLHTKIVLVDDVVACVGSANFDNRAKDHDAEVMAVVFDPDVVRVLDDHLTDDLSRAEPVDPNDWENRSILQRVKEAAVNTIDDHI